MVADPNNTLTYWSGGELDDMAASRTTNGGLSWTRYSIVNPGYAHALAVDPSNSAIVYIGGDPGAYKTTNSGTSWNACSSGLTGFVYDFAINPAATNIIYAATPNGVFRSTNGGTSWINTGCTDVTAVLVDPDDPAVLYAGTGSGVYKSTNSGGTWTVMNDGLEDLSITCLGIYPTAYLYSGTENAGMYRWEINVGVKENHYAEATSTLSVFPNPSSRNMTISYSLSTRIQVELSLYDAQGRCIAILADGIHDAGTHRRMIDAKSSSLKLAAGVYFCRLETPGTKAVKKIVLLQ